jgi:hypothetical protein
MRKMKRVRDLIAKSLRCSPLVKEKNVRGKWKELENLPVAYIPLLAK